MTHRNLGDSLVRIGRRADALVSYQRAAALAEEARQVNPADAQNLASLALFLAKAGDGASARRHVSEAVRLSPDDVFVWNRAAQVHAVLGNLEEALTALARAIELEYPQAEAASVDEFEPLRAHPRYKQLTGD